jgi:hypothetical protein
VRGGGAIGASTSCGWTYSVEKKIIGVFYSWRKPLSIQRSNNIVNVDFVVGTTDRGRFSPRSDGFDKLFLKPRGSYLGLHI